MTTTGAETTTRAMTTTATRATMGTLLRLRLRRDALQVALWVVGTGLLALVSVAGIGTSYSTEQDRVALLGTAVANPVILLFRGLPSGADEGPFAAFLILPFLAMMAAFMSSFLAVRHTRAEEDAGRAELVASTRAGRTRPLVATAIHGLVANVVLAAVVGVAFVATGLDPVGSVAAGAASGATGLVFLGVGSLCAQVLPSSRAANSAAVWLLLLTYVLAGVGNAIGTPSQDLHRVESSGLAWASPFGWAENVRPFADDAGGPVLLSSVVAVVLVAAAVVVQRSRDLGESLLPERVGRRDASATLSTPVGLAWRLSWPAIVGWAAGGLLTGAFATALAPVLQDAASSLSSVQAIIDSLSAGGSLAEGAIVIFFTMLGILAAGCGVQVICRTRQEETHGTAETVLATTISPMRWLGGYVVVAFAGVVLVVAAAIVGAAAGLASQSGPDWSLLSDAVVTGAGQVVAASVFLGITALVFVVLPRLTIPLGWAVLLIGTILGLFGGLFGFPDWLVDLSPVASGPTIGADGVDLRGLWWLALAAAAGVTAALTLMRRREIVPAG